MNALRTIAALSLLAAAVSARAGTVSVIVVDKEGKPVPDAVVVVTPAARGVPRQPLPTSLTILQSKMQFVPALSVVSTGARLTFANMDTWEHHVRGSAAGLAQFGANATGGFELRVEGKAEGKPPKTAEAVMDKTGAVLLGCHLHGSMRGHVYVSDSPWAMKTSPEGQVVMDDVPDGTATVRVWHADQLIDLPVQSVVVGAAPARASVQLQVVPRRRRI